MAEDLRGPVVPAQLNYSSALPVAIESKSTRRLFYPNNGEKFQPGGVNQIRMNINSNNLMDFTHSYMQMEFKNDGGGTVGLDKGVPFIKRLQIQNQGADLEDIQEYHRLHAMLMDVQGSDNNENEWSTCYHRPQVKDAKLVKLTAADIIVTDVDPEQYTAAEFGDTDGNKASAKATNDYSIPTSVIANGEDATVYEGAALAGKPGNVTGLGDGAAFSAANCIKHINASTIKLEHNLVQAMAGVTIDLKNQMDTLKGITNNAVDQLANTETRVFNFPLISMIFNLEKYFPLILTNSGLDIIMHLAPAVEVGVWDALNHASYEISKVRYVAHVVDLDATFYDRLRASVAASNGVLTLAGTTYKHYLNNYTTQSADPETSDHVISTRVKSLKALLTRCVEVGSDAEFSKFSIGVGQNPFIGGAAGVNTGKGQYQYRIGSVLYPASAVQVSANNIGESVQEVRKAFGTIGDYQHGTFLNKDNCTTPVNKDTCTSGSRYESYVFGYDFEGFSKTATESGINISDRALNVSMQLQTTTNSNAISFHTFAMCDCMLYLGIDGSLTTRI